MPTTRSMRSLSALAGSATSPATQSPRSAKKTKRKAQDADVSEQPSALQDTKKSRIESSSTSILQAGKNQLLPAVLSFSFETAKQHLIQADARFQDIFEKLPCRPFEQLERVDPFRTLVTSILGQQISWIAARSILHKFIRLYDPSLPEKPPPLVSNSEKNPQDFFPTPNQVINTDIATLKSAGLSTRKAEYVQDLASRFADGRLTNDKLVQADDEELARLLIEVRGIGRWTVDMFALFSLRRPDILPIGDLGVQRGVLRWFLSLHSPSDPVTISPKKLPKAPGNTSDGTGPTPFTVSAQDSGNATSNPVSLPAPLPSGTTVSLDLDVSSVPPVPITPVKNKNQSSHSLLENESLPPSSDKFSIDTGGMPMLPEPFTPSINKILNSNVSSNTDVNGNGAEKKLLAPLPEGLTVASLKSRLSGKKVKGAFLTPTEMETLTEPWRPYRSLGVYYMWALAEEKTS